MSRNTKIALAVVVGLLLLCICCSCVLVFGSTQLIGTTLAQSMVTEPAAVATIGAKIADYETPAGYDEQFGMSFFVFDMVGFIPADEEQGVVIFMMQFPAWLNMDQAAMEQQMQQSIQQQRGGPDVQFEVVEQKPVTIRDQTVTLTTQEGTDEKGQTVRQMIGVFPGKGGPAMLMIMGNSSTWDQTSVDSFIASLR